MLAVWVLVASDIIYYIITLLNGIFSLIDNIGAWVDDVWAAVDNILSKVPESLRTGSSKDHKDSKEDDEVGGRLLNHLCIEIKVM